MNVARVDVVRFFAQLAFVAITSTICWIFYKGLKDPLRTIPGPWYASYTSLVLKYKVLTGQRLFYIHDLHQKYGPLVRVDPNEVNVCDLDTYREIHRIGSGFTKSDWYDLATPGIENNIFTMRKVNEHAARRKLLARPFSRSSLLANFQLLVTDRARLAVSKIKKEAMRGDCDIMKWWTLMTTDVITQVAFGVDSRLLEAGQKTQYIDDLETSIKAWAFAGEVPWLYSLMRIFSPNITREFDRCLQNVVTYGTTAAFQARNGALQRYNIISGMINDSRAEGTSLTDFDLGSQASALIIAGSGTTAVTLTYAIWAILMHPEVRKRLAEEVCSLSPDYDDTVLEQLPYLKAVVTETLRLYGSAPGALPRTTPSKGIEIKGNYIPPGVTLTTQSYTMHRDPSIFLNPDSFDPQRFYRKDLAGSQKQAYGPFGGGTRVCLGIHLAEMELRHGIAEFFREGHDIVLSENTTPESMEMENYFLISPKSKKCLVRLKSSSVL